jgi:hypothetical protein
MAVYGEGSVRLLWIDRTRRSAGREETGLLCDPDCVVSGRIWSAIPSDEMPLSMDYDQTWPQPTSMSASTC